MADRSDEGGRADLEEAVGTVKRSNRAELFVSLILEGFCAFTGGLQSTGHLLGKFAQPLGGVVECELNSESGYRACL
jgi:hypothetical protein